MAKLKKVFYKNRFLDNNGKKGTPAIQQPSLRQFIYHECN